MKADTTPSQFRRIPFAVPLACDGKPLWASLARSAPISRTRSAVPVPLLERKPAPRTRTGFSRAVNLAVRNRAGRGDIEDAACEACGVWLGRCGGRLQRRCARGPDDHVDVTAGSAANWVLLCPGHLALASARDPQMEAMGFWLRGGAGPLQEPVLLHRAGERPVTAWLAEDGYYLFEAPACAPAAASRSRSVRNFP